MAYKRDDLREDPEDSFMTDRTLEENASKAHGLLYALKRLPGRDEFRQTETGKPDRMDSQSAVSMQGFRTT